MYNNVKLKIYIVFYTGYLSAKLQVWHVLLRSMVVQILQTYVIFKESMF